MAQWRDMTAALEELAARRLFFVGGAPRSGTTWLQQLLDAHPDVSCNGEGQFQRAYTGPIDEMLTAHARLLTEKNTALFSHTGGYPLPMREDGAYLLRTAILLALRRQSEGRACRAVGEKTPENVFFFARLLELFPDASFIAIARDPRDVLTSAWHFFHRNRAPGGDDQAQLMAFIRGALPSLVEGARVTIAFAQRHPDRARVVTYEALQQDPVGQMAALFRFLGVSDAPDLVGAAVARTRFAEMTGGRPAGTESSGSFLRKGVVGDWRSTLTPEMAELVMRELGWTFSYFGLRPA